MHSIDGKSQELMQCCNLGYGCPHCYCFPCWDSGKLPVCDNLEWHHKNSSKDALLCKKCFKNVKEICSNHLWTTLLNTRDIKWEKLDDPEYRNQKIEWFNNLWADKYEHRD